MWAGALRTRACHTRRWAQYTVPRLRRNYNGSPQQGQHTTYFQSPESPPKPPRRWLRGVLLGGTCFFLGAFTVAWSVVDQIEILDDEDQEAGVPHGVHPDELNTALQALSSRTPPVMTVDLATRYLDERSSYSISPATIAHTCQSPSNLPCEDTWQAGDFGTPTRQWSMWAIFDGHAGSQTSSLLQISCLEFLTRYMWLENGWDMAYVPNDPKFNTLIKKAFIRMDQEILERAETALNSDAPRAEVIARSAAALSGSCALVALYDHASSALHVANVGDSRAVLGRWDKARGRYIAEAMSVDQTGFNQAEVARINDAHPGEDVIDPKTGRVHGLAVSRAFGDARWKWSQALNRLAFNSFWGPKPRPDGLIKTPPYLTAEPEMTDTRVQSDPVNPDFLIMASDGLWDCMSSEDAVACVQLWLENYHPTKHMFERVPNIESLTTYGSLNAPLPPLPVGPAEPEEDVYFDESTQQLAWRVSPKHFVVEDNHCGTHLIKNALGGNRRNLFTGVMGVQPPLSRNVRDDITVSIVFFGVDTSHVYNRNGRPGVGAQA